MSENSFSEATFAAGCFWCVEAVFDRINGVEHVESGYSGGHVKNPAYREVCNGTTGHAEVIRIRFNPAVVGFETLLEVFFQTHDPTTLNRQGGDVGTQYRSAVFYHDAAQQRLAEAAKAAVDASGIYANPVVTEISPLENYYPAEDYHQNYFAYNADQPYCAAVIRPKMDKFRTKFAALIKDSAAS